MSDRENNHALRILPRKQQTAAFRFLATPCDVYGLVGSAYDPLLKIESGEVLGQYIQALNPRTLDVYDRNGPTQDGTGYSDVVAYNRTSAVPAPMGALLDVWAIDNEGTLEYYFDRIGDVGTMKVESVSTDGRTLTATWAPSTFVGGYSGVWGAGMTPISVKVARYNNGGTEYVYPRPWDDGLGETIYVVGGPARSIIDITPRIPLFNTTASMTNRHYVELYLDGGDSRMAAIDTDT